MRHTLASVLIAALAATLPGLAQTPAPVPAAAPRPPDELPLTRLKADATLAVALAPGAVATETSLWIATGAGPVSVEAKTNTPAAPVALPGAPCASLAWGAKALWVPQCAARTLARVDETSRAVTTAALAPSDAGGSIAACVGSVWMASDATGVVSRIDPETREVVAEVFVAREPAGVACADDVLWITSAAGATLSRVNPHTNVLGETATVGPRPGRVVVGEGAVWTLNRGDHSVTRVDPATSKVVTTIAVGYDVGAGDIAVGEGSVWLSAPGSPLIRLDAKTNRVAQRFTGPGGGAVAVAHGSLWIAVDATTTWRVDPRLVAALRP